MKKKLLTFILMITAMFTGVVGLTACEKESTPPQGPAQSSNDMGNESTHTHTYTSTTKQPTCAEKGLTTYTCACGDSYTEEIPATGEHTWDDGVETTAPTCAKEGETTYTCTVCQTATKTEPIDKLPHEHSAEWSSNATHHWYECECGDKKDEAEHTPSGPATATTAQVCTVCDYVIQAETGILFNTLDVDGTKVSAVMSNATTEFSFLNEVTVKGEAKYIVALDKNGMQTVVTKIVSLEEGDNVFYVFEVVDDEVTILYEVTIRRRPMYEVTFNTNGGTSVEKQVIEEDFLATEPETTRAGYTFSGWDYDFATPITDNTEITARWTANGDTKYIVSYYLQNLDDDEYTLRETVELSGETDTTATAIVKAYDHFTYNASASTISGNIDGNGALVLSVYYTRDSYSIIANNNNAKAGTATSVSGTYKFDKEFTLTATTNAGYTWLGWYDGETLACETEEFTFKAEKDVTYTATWSVNTDTKYTVNYYLQNLDDDEYTLRETVELTGETDTTASATIQEYAHFTFNASASTISGNIDGDGNQVLKVYYTRNTYTLSVENTSIGAITNSGIYKYGKELSTTATPCLGYELVGWYSGETLLSTDLTYTFTVTQNVTAKFEEKEEMSNFHFTFTMKTCEITGIKDKTVMEIIVPDYVTSISEGAFSGCSSLTEITLPFVGAQAGKTANDTYQYPFGYIFGTSSYTGGTATTQYYYGSSTSTTSSTYYYIPTSLKKVTITGGNILYGAFYNCYSLTSVEIGDSVTSIGEYAFRGCSRLTSVEIGDSVTSIGNYAFSECSSLTSVEIGDSVTSIGEYAFAYCSSLTSVVIPDSVTSIGEDAFAYCSSLTSVEIGDSVTSIGIYAFYGCSSLTSVVIGDSVTSIGEWAFYKCSSLKSVYITDIETWCNISFGSSSTNPLYYAKNLYLNDELVTELVIPDSVTSIGNSVFYGCSSLTSVVIGDSVTSIGSYAFYSCDSLTSVVIGDSVTSIGEWAFAYCSSLKSVVIPDSVTSISSGAFSGCSGLTEITLPFVGAQAGKTANDTYQYPFGYIFGTNSYTGDTATTQYYYGSSTSSTTYSNYYIPKSLKKVTITGGNILYGAFYGCSSLTSVVIPDSVTSIGSSAFAYCSSLTSIVIPDSVTSIGEDAFSYCKGLTSIVIPDSVTSIGEDAFSGCSSLTSVVIGDGVENIGTNAFYSCDSLTSIEIPDSVTSIGEWAFAYCSSLKSVVIPDSVTSISSGAFRECSSLTSVVIGDSVTSIGSYAFYSCDSLTSVVIGDSVTSIGEWAFAYCSSLKSVVIPDSVTSISSGAFSGCSGLTEITLPFVGAQAGKTANDTYQYPFGYIFGTNSYTGDTATTQYYYGSSTSSTTYSTYYIPKSLKKVTITGGNILYGAFYGCSSLTSVVIPDSVTSIGSSAFRGCSSLTSIVIPDSVTSIGYYAFYDCSSLKSVTFKDTSTWYRTTSSSNWNNKTGGTETTVTTPSKNATYFKSTYYNYYWYKL